MKLHTGERVYLIRKCVMIGGIGTVDTYTRVRVLNHEGNIVAVKRGWWIFSWIEFWPRACIKSQAEFDYRPVVMEAS